MFYEIGNATDEEILDFIVEHMEQAGEVISF